MINEEKILCPVCDVQAKKIKSLSQKFIQQKLALHFNTEITTNLEMVDYAMMQCPACSFEFAYPPVEGPGAFYNWITAQPSYYTQSRWEYFKVIELLTDKNKPLSLLDVGCGDGRFFDQVRQSEISNIELCGLDPTEGCVATCKAKGYTVFCMDIANFKSAFPDRSFDAVTAYHVLEHIADPKKFLSELISLISGTGAIYISTPYSPMNFELAWYDVLNHPPHHMGRWNLEVYKKLAANLKLELEVFMPAGEGLLKAATLSFMFATHGPLTTYPKIKILKSIARHPIKFFKHLHKQSQRTKIAGKRVSNVILVKFTKLQGALGIANI